MNRQTVLAEMQRISHLAAGPLKVEDNVKSRIAKAARRLGLSYRRARSLWYADRSIAPRAEELDRLRAIERQLLDERRRRLRLELSSIDARLSS